MWDDEEVREFRVVVNHEEQYSIWPSGRDVPSGWREVGKSGNKSECLAHIKEVWTDLRPLSLRLEIEEWEKRRAAEPPVARPVAPSDPVDDLVRRLGEKQEVAITVRPTRTIGELRAAITRGRVHVTFVQTDTELGIPVAPALAAESCLDAGTGTIALEGVIVLNFNRVRFEGEFDVATLRGTGRLQFLEAVTPKDLFVARGERN